MRRAELDRLRTGAVVLVIFYHVCYLYNGVGIPGALPGASSLPVFDGFLCFVYPWMMALLFCIAGICARCSLNKRTVRAFLAERVRRLLIPSTLGVAVFHWITGYMSVRAAGALDLIPFPLRYPVFVLSGIGPLWFSQTLFLFCCALAALRSLDREDRLWHLGGRANLAVVLALVFPLWGASQVLNMPVVTVYRFGIYFAAFLIGYLVLSHDAAQSALERACLPLLAAALLLGALYTVRHGGEDYTAAPLLQSFETNLYMWIAVLALIGLARARGGAQTRAARFLTDNSFALYVLHYPVLQFVCAGLLALGLPAIVRIPLAFALGIAGSLALGALIARIPLLRRLVLGKS